MGGNIMNAWDLLYAVMGIIEEHGNSVTCAKTADGELREFEVKYDEQSGQLVID